MLKFRNLLKRVEKPKHIAIVTKGKTLWAIIHNTEIDKVYQKSFEIINSLLAEIVKQDIPVITFYLLATEIKDIKQFSTLTDALNTFFISITSKELIHKNRIKISVLGRWYDLPGRVVDSIKQAIEITKDYDNFFLNFCINYDGQEEILNAVKLISKQVQTGKIDPNFITKETIKDNIYSSYFIPPELIIINGYEKSTSGVLLWDSARSHIYFTNKLWPDFSKADLLAAIKDFEKTQKLLEKFK